MSMPRPRISQSLRDVYAADCGCRLILDLLADKWSALALAFLEPGPARFGALKAKLDGISPKVLTAVLRRLEEHELITRTAYPDVTLHVEYELTDLGRDACVPLGALLYWVEDNIQRFPAPS
jgi:DNA-binding HxlR family transcriptional regulator